MALKILIADDHKIVRDGLRHLLEDQAQYVVIGEAENGRKAVQLARKHHPDIVIMDISMPDLNGIDATHQMIAENSGVKVIALSMHSDKQYVDQMLKAGVSGYLLKDCAFEELDRALRVIAGGGIYLSPDVAGLVVQDYVGQLHEKAPEPSVAMTVREREVLQLIAEGHSTKSIANALNISVKTVETHRKNIMEKMNARSVAELTKIALREGLTTL
ncbi:response regulator [Desulfococcus sp.]|uniref:response regulator n=1 Tax=Desulfococcus sp. TaxID=2025834 RepID=UPI003D0AB8D1